MADPVLGRTELEHLERLGEIIQSGTCVLFLGAGVSLDSGAPNGGQLAKDLGQRFLPTDPESTDLGQVCELIDATEGRRALNDWLIERFRGLTPPAALLSIPRFRWKSIYTMNFDTLLEEAYRQTPDALQRLHHFYYDKDPLSHLGSGEAPLYKLHGCLSRAYADDGRLVLTPDDFARVYESRRRFFNRLLEDVSDYTIFYVGFGRSDQDFRRVLLDVERAAGQLTDLRRSYALQPGYRPSQATFWEGKRVTLIDAAAVDFFRGLEGNLAPEERYVPRQQARLEAELPLLRQKPKVTREILIDVERNFEVIDERVRLQTPNGGEFFSGAQPNWAAIAVGVDAPRDLKDEVLATVLQDVHLDRQGVQFGLVHAEAGSGKTTLLRRLGVDLALTWERIVIALKPFGELDFLALERLATAADERVYVLVDDAVSVARDLSQLLMTARRAKARLTVLATARTNEWREVQDDYGFPGVEEFELQQLSRVEIEAVIASLTKHDALGLLAGVSHDAKVAAFETRANKQLLVALREATEGKHFDEIVVDEYDRIPSPEGQLAYLLVASLHRFGVLMRAGLLHRALGISLDEIGWRVLEPTTKVIVTQEPLGEADYYYTTRHPLIAEIVFDRKLVSDRRRLEYYQDLIKHLDLGYSSDLDAYRKLTRGKNRQLLRDFDNADNRRELMRQLVQLDQSDAFAYQHAAMMELDERNLEAAAKYLNRAITLLPLDASIRDTEGRLALLSAVAELNPILADEKFARAEDIFQRNIQRRREEPYSYRHLAETYVRWADQKDKQEEKLRYVGLSYQVLLNGLDRCSSSSMLLQFQADLEQRVLGNPENAREIFAKILHDKPGDTVTRFLAAKLEERQGRLEQALEILLRGLDTQPYEPKLHFRIAELMAVVRAERDAEIRSHFEAALLGPIRDYRPRLTYGAYLFAQRDFEKANQQFAMLDQLVVANRERYEPRRFEFGLLKDRHTGRIRRLSYGYGTVEFAQGAAEVFFSPLQMPKLIGRKLRIGQVISFEIRFNLKGAVAVGIDLADEPAQLALTLTTNNGRRRS